MRYCALKNSIVTSLIPFLTLFFPSIDSAAQMRLAWNPNTESDLAGYKVYYGTASRTYGSCIDVGNVNISTVPGLTQGVTYYFAVTAYDSYGNESGYSNEVYATLAPTDPEAVSVPNVLSGTTSGAIGSSYPYTTGGSGSSLGDPVQYQFDWIGDGTSLSPWGSATQYHAWTSPGTYNVRARARCAIHTSVVSLWVGPISVSISQTTLSYTVTTNPSGRQITVDGTNYTAPQTFNWAAGSSHTLSGTSPQSGGSGAQYVYASWSDGGAQSHSITVPSSSAIYTASFTTQYSLTTTVSPFGEGTVSPSGTGWRNSGQSISISATANAGYTFLNWSGDLSSSANPTSITMNGPKNVTANFSAVTAKMHVGDLDSTSQNFQKNKWIANMTIEVHGVNEQPVARAAVSGKWSGGGTGSGSCVTDASGRCTVSSGPIPIQKATATFTVNNATQTTLSYDASSNHDPDGDSNGTFIVISKPK